MSTPGRRASRSSTAAAFHQVENGFYITVALALALAGAALFVDAVYQFAVSSGEGSLRSNVLDLLDGLLLVFIVTELLHTVRTVINENVLRTEPFLIVGIVATIRRLIVISAEADDFVGDPRFSDLMIEMGVLVGAAVGLGITIFLLRRRAQDRDDPDLAGDVESDRAKSN